MTLRDLIEIRDRFRSAAVSYSLRIPIAEFVPELQMGVQDRAALSAVLDALAACGVTFPSGRVLRHDDAGRYGYVRGDVSVDGVPGNGRVEVGCRLPEPHATRTEEV